MNISKQEAQESLAQIESAISQTRKAMGGHTGPILMLWGAIWTIGFSLMQFVPGGSFPYWLALDAAGFFGTWLCIKKARSNFRRPGFGRVALAWLILFGYMILWGFLLQPVHGRAEIAFFSTVCMCGYAMMGLWLDRFLLWLGVAVTALTVIGFYFAAAWFPLWMGITGGGALFFSGLYICKSWK
ncbi:MAG: hypothetical protein ACREFE_08620 [Limisphaerales bacterium]